MPWKAVRSRPRRSITRNASLAGRKAVREDDAMAKWMQKAFANSHGQFKAKAKKAGKSTAAFARQELKAGSNATTKTKRQANLALRGIEAARGGKKGSRHDVKR